MLILLLIFSYCNILIKRWNNKLLFVLINCWKYIPLFLLVPKSSHNLIIKLFCHFLQKVYVFIIPPLRWTLSRWLFIFIKTLCFMAVTVIVVTFNCWSSRLIVILKWRRNIRSLWSFDPRILQWLVVSHSEWLLH